MKIITRTALILGLLVLGLTAQASSTRSLDADDIKSPDHSRVSTLPSTTGTLLNQALTSANLFIGNGSNIATSTAMSGESTITNAGVVTLGTTAVTGKVLTGFSSGAGTVSSSDTILGAFQKIDGNLKNSAATAMAANDVDWSLAKAYGAGYLYLKTLSANTTFTFSNVSAGQVVNIAVTNTASNYTLAWPGAAKFAGGSAPTQTVGAKTDYYSCHSYDGTNAYCNAVQNF